MAAELAHKEYEKFEKQKLLSDTAPLHPDFEDSLKQIRNVTKKLKNVDKN